MIDYTKALANPEKIFGNPKHVVADTTLTKAQKLKILEQWKHDATLMEIAEEENMGPENDTPPTMLSRIDRAIIAVKASH